MSSDKNSLVRCPWVGDDPLYQQYHDEEWGVPVHDDRVLFEFLILEGAQAGLSWSTILRKRENYVTYFAAFDPTEVAQFDQARVQALLHFEGIVRNRLKIEATVSNARHFLEIQAEFGSFAAYLWSFVDHNPIQNSFRTLNDYPASTPVSDRLSKDLKRRGFRFVGSTICYAYMQAVGLVNDHTLDCFRHEEVRDLAKPNG